MAASVDSIRNLLDDDSMLGLHQMGANRFECLTAALVLIDLALITHQLAIDLTLNRSECDGASCNLPGCTPEMSQFFIAVLILSVGFVFETLWRNGRNLMRLRRLVFLDAIDGGLCITSCAIDFGLHFGCVSRTLRDLLALLVAVRLIRVAQLFRGLSYTEKQLLLQLLASRRQDEAVSAERLKMLQMELSNRDLECQNLRALIKAATLSRHRLRMKQQLQVGQALPLSPPQARSHPEPTQTRAAGRERAGSLQCDSGHNSDCSPDSPQEPAGAAAAGGQAPLPGSRELLPKQQQDQLEEGQSESLSDTANTVSTVDETQ